MTVCQLIRAGFVLLALDSSIACGLKAQTAAEETFDRTLAVRGPVTLDIRTPSGSIDIYTGSAGSMRVVGRIREASWLSEDVADRIRRIAAAPPIKQDGDTIRIGHIGDERLFRNISISYELSVPLDRGCGPTRGQAARRSPA